MLMMRPIQYNKAKNLQDFFDQSIPTFKSKDDN